MGALAVRVEFKCFVSALRQSKTTLRQSKTAGRPKVPKARPELSLGMLSSVIELGTSAAAKTVAATETGVLATDTIKNGAETTENGAETKHLNSTRTARPPKGPGSSSRIQMLKSSCHVLTGAKARSAITLLYCLVKVTVDLFLREVLRRFCGSFVFYGDWFSCTLYPCGGQHPRTDFHYVICTPKSNVQVRCSES